MVIRWNDVTIDVLRADRTLPGPTWSSRTFAMVQAAVFDAVNGIDGSYEPYLVTTRAPRGASMDAAVAMAAHDVLVAIYPDQRRMLAQKLTQSLLRIHDGPLSELVGAAYGRRVAKAVLLNRADDGSNDTPIYTPDGQPGHWESDPMNPGQTALAPGWGDVAPFVMNSGDQFLPPPPPDMTSAAYTAAFNEVKSLGDLHSTTRTAEQTQIGHFWGYDRPGMGTPPALYNQIIQVVADQEHNAEVRNARLFFLANLAQADAGIAAWDCKYVDNFWRPVSAIRRADEDGNPDTIADPNWQPLGAPGDGVIPNFTPPFPAYVSGHATFGAAVFQVLSKFYGTDQYNFTITSDELPGVSRSFTSFSQAAAENGRSRIYLGIHWNFDDIQGEALGRSVGDWVFQNAGQPKSFEDSSETHFACITPPPRQDGSLWHAAKLVADFDFDPN
jgi:hypothetical protein